MAKNKTLGLVLSGGGAKGIAHIGVLQALEEMNIKPDFISGTSAGAIAGALYAQGIPPMEILEFVKTSSVYKVFRMGLPRDGLTSLAYLREKLAELIPHDSFEGLQIPLFVTTTNLLQGELEVFSSGPLHAVVEASSSVPLMFKPVEINGQLYADGGIIDNMPVKPLLGKVDVLMGVNVMPVNRIQAKNCQNMLGIAHRVFNLGIWVNTQPNIAHCDIYLEPAELEDYTILALNQYEKLFDIGYQAALAIKGDILYVVD